MQSPNYDGQAERSFAYFLHTTQCTTYTQKNYTICCYNIAEHITLKTVLVLLNSFPLCWLFLLYISLLPWCFTIVHLNFIIISMTQHWCGVRYSH